MTEDVQGLREGRQALLHCDLSRLPGWGGECTGETEASDCKGRHESVGNGAILCPEGHASDVALTSGAQNPGVQWGP